VIAASAAAEGGHRDQDSSECNSKRDKGAPLGDSSQRLPL
jgi:hypothetical protein